LKAALDAEFRVEKTDDMITLINTKMKDAAPPVEMCFRLETVKLGVGSDGSIIESAALVKEERGRQTKKKRLSQNERLALASFNCAAPVSGRLDAEGNFGGLHLEDWRLIFYKMSTADNTDTKKRAFGRARKELVNKGEVSLEDDVYLLTGELSAFDHSEFAKKLKAVAEAKLKDNPVANGGRDTGQGGTNEGQVPVPSREEPGQAGQGSIDPSAVPPGVDVELIKNTSCDAALEG